MERHEIIFRATRDGETTSLEIRCACGSFLLDRMGQPAEASLIEITQIVAAHYAHVAHPEYSNGTTKLIKGRK